MYTFDFVRFEGNHQTVWNLTLINSFGIVDGQPDTEIYQLSVHNCDDPIDYTLIYNYSQEIIDGILKLIPFEDVDFVDSAIFEPAFAAYIMK